MHKRIVSTVNIHRGAVSPQSHSSTGAGLDDPVETGKRYLDLGADEILLKNLSASRTERASFLAVVSRARKAFNVPLSATGGIRCAEDIDALLSSGCDKVIIS